MIWDEEEEEEEEEKEEGGGGGVGGLGLYETHLVTLALYF